jgi:hypothetical protein
LRIGKITGAYGDTDRRETQYSFHFSEEKLVVAKKVKTQEI